MTIWFTSDLHLGHANIIRYCNRPFTNVEEMNEKLINNWNTLVKPGDSVYNLGDFAFHREPSIFFNRLNGCKYLIKGNHDKHDTMKLPWQFIKDVHMLRLDSCSIFLSHYSHRVWPEGHHGVIHLFGHSHGGLSAHGKSFDVGVDAWNYAPISMEQVVEYSRNLPDLKHHGD
jgi:calcineurin-like phosphoesterase family protein